jgi:hypothetical protein
VTGARGYVCAICRRIAWGPKLPKGWLRAPRVPRGDVVACFCDTCKVEPVERALAKARERMRR